MSIFVVMENCIYVSLVLFRLGIIVREKEPTETDYS